MASEILGLFTSPEMYQRQQDLMMQRQAAELAQLDPYQSIRYGAIRSGQQFGRGLAGLLGAEDPQLRMISARQSVLGGIDLSNPDSILSAARQLANVGDQQGALALADYGRKAQADAALVAQRMREKPPAELTKEIKNARVIAKSEGLEEDSPAFAQRVGALVNAALTKPTKELSYGDEREAKSLELYGTSFAQITPEQRAKVNAAIAKPAKEPSYGTDREAAAQELYGKNFGELSQTEKAAVNKLVEDRQGRTAEKGAPKFVMPGKKEPIDIPKLRKSLTDSLEPYKSTIDAGDSAVSLLNQAKVNKNASSFNSGITELAKMTQGGRLSNKDVELARVDPAVLRRAQDFVSTTFQGVPTESTINDIISTVKLLRKVASDKYAREVNTQRKIASKAEIDKETIDILFEDTTLPAAPTGRGKTTTRTLKSGKTVTITED
jgi:hypothetical protein